MKIGSLILALSMVSGCIQGGVLGQYQAMDRASIAMTEKYGLVGDAPGDVSQAVPYSTTPGPRPDFGASGIASFYSTQRAINTSRPTVTISNPCRGGRR
jgi:hypothetical protein